MRIQPGAISLMLVVGLALHAVVPKRTDKKLYMCVIVTVCAVLLCIPRSFSEFSNYAVTQLSPAKPASSTSTDVTFPYPRSEADAKALANQLLDIINKLGASEQSGEVFMHAVLHKVRSTSSYYGIPFPILQHATLTGTAPFPVHSAVTRISWHSLDLQLPNSVTSIKRHIFSLDIPATAQLALLFILLYHTIRLVHFHRIKRRHHNRLAKNLCPHCAYPIPTSPPT